MTNLPITGKFNITATYGQTGPYWKNGHKGIDFTCDNLNIYATCDGTVKVVSYDANGWGQYVSIHDQQGSRHIFCHLVKGSVKVKVGQNVNRTTIIGTMGATGNVTGRHLHYQINDKNNIPINPCPYLGIPNKKGVYDSNDYQIAEEKPAPAPENTAKEEEDVTQEQFNKMMDVYLSQLAAQPIDPWAKEDMAWAQKEGLINGDENGNTMPRKFLTREELAAVLHRYDGKK